MKKKKLILIIGPSGSGKTTLIKNLIKQCSSQLVFVPSFTSRLIRSEEKNGKSYFFISKDEFKKKIQNNEFLEYKIVNGFFYGLDYSKIQNFFKKYPFIIKDVEILGAIDIIKRYGKNVLSFFLDVKSKSTLIKRLEKREGYLDSFYIDTRLNRKNLENLFKNYFNYYLINSDLEKSKNFILKKIQSSDNLSFNKRKKISIFFIHPNKSLFLVIKKKYNIDSDLEIPEESFFYEKEYLISSIYRQFCLLFYPSYIPKDKKDTIVADQKKLIKEIRYYKNKVICKLGKNLEKIGLNIDKKTDSENYFLSWVDKKKIEEIIYQSKNQLKS